jgi:hypothetical protein
MTLDERDIRANRGLREQRIRGGASRAYFIYRLRKKGLHKLADKVVQRKISANEAAVTAGLIARQKYIPLTG